MKDEMFKIHLQTFAEEGEEGKTEPTEKVVEDKPKEEPKKEEETSKKPEFDIDAIIEKITPTIEEKFSKQKEEEINTLSQTFEEKLKAIKEEANKDKENYQKLIEGLKTNKDTKDIIAEIEEHNNETKKAKEQRELLEAKEKAIQEAKSAKEQLEDFKKQMQEKEKQDNLKAEQANFKATLLQEAKEKPYIADKIDKILLEEDYETQKHDYRTLLKFFDTEEEKERYEAKKSAGTSAFEGVKSSKDGNSDNDLRSFNQKYIQELLEKKTGKKKPKQ